MGEEFRGVDKSINTRREAIRKAEGYLNPSSNNEMVEARHQANLILGIHERDAFKEYKERLRSNLRRRQIFRVSELYMEERVQRDIDEEMKIERDIVETIPVQSLLIRLRSFQYGTGSALTPRIVVTAEYFRNHIDKDLIGRRHGMKIIRGTLLNTKSPNAESVGEVMSKDDARRFALVMYDAYSNRDRLINEYIEWGNRHPGEGPSRPSLTRLQINDELNHELANWGKRIEFELAGKETEGKELSLRKELSRISYRPDDDGCTFKSAIVRKYLICIDQLPPGR